MTNSREIIDKKKRTKIIGIQFSILSPDEIRRCSVAEITSRDTYINNKPVIGGLFDPRMLQQYAKQAVLHVAPQKV